MPAACNAATIGSTAFWPRSSRYRAAFASASDEPIGASSRNDRRTSSSRASRKERGTLTTVITVTLPVIGPEAIAKSATGAAGSTPVVAIRMRTRLRLGCRHRFCRMRVTWTRNSQQGHLEDRQRPGSDRLGIGRRMERDDRLVGHPGVDGTGPHRRRNRQQVGHPPPDHESAGRSPSTSGRPRTPGSSSSSRSRRRKEDNTLNERPIPTGAPAPRSSSRPWHGWIARSGTRSTSAPIPSSSARWSTPLSSDGRAGRRLRSPTPG